MKTLWKKAKLTLFGVGLIALLYQCGIFEQGNEVELLNRREMRKLLTDLHLLEGVLGAHYEGYTEREKVYYYHALFKKHQTTKEAFDSSLAYFTRNPKIFERLYQRVLVDLNKLKSQVEAGKFHPILPDSLLHMPLKYELWHKATALHVNHDSLRNALDFRIVDPALLSQDLYHWKFRIRIAPQDTSHSAFAALRIHYQGDVVDSVMHPLPNDSVLRRFTFRMPALRNFKIDSITGTFMSSALFGKVPHVTIDSISFLREYLPAFQDSIRLNLDTLPNAQSALQPIERQSAELDHLHFRLKTPWKWVISPELLTPSNSMR